MMMFNIREFLEVFVNKQQGILLALCFLRKRVLFQLFMYGRGYKKNIRYSGTLSTIYKVNETTTTN